MSQVIPQDEAVKRELAATASTPMALIEMAVGNDADPAKLEKLMELQERWESKIAREQYCHAVAAFQGECPQIKKERSIDMGRGSGPTYASFDDIMRVVQPLLTKHGLSVMFDTSVGENNMLTVVCRVLGHGHEERNSVTLPMPASMKVNDTQKMGAANKYGQRYALVNALNIVVTDEDTDAAGLDLTPINDNQANAIEELLSQCNPDDRTRFWVWLQLQPGQYDRIPASRFTEIVDKLRSKIGGD
ncbi:MAG: ERF family protein, partial [Planctomycetota bacterium]